MIPGGGLLIPGVGLMMRGGGLEFPGGGLVFSGWDQRLLGCGGVGLRCANPTYLWLLGCGVVCGGRPWALKNKGRLLWGAARVVLAALGGGVSSRPSS